MSLRTRSLLIIGATLLALVAILFMIERLLITDAYDQLETADTERRVHQVLNMIDLEGMNLSATLEDWASWDDAYAFVADRQAAFVTSNLGDETFETLRLNLIYITDRDANVVYARGYDLDSGRDLPLPEFSPEFLAVMRPFVQGLTPDNAFTGLVQGIGSPMLIAIRPILRSDGSGPTRGLFAMGRPLDRVTTDVLGEALLQPFHLTPLDPGNPGAVLGADVIGLLDRGSGSVATRAVNGDVVRGSAVLRDLFGAPLALVDVDVPRDIQDQGARTFRTVALAVGIAGGLLVLSVLGVLEWTVLGRLARLNRRVHAIAGSVALDERLPREGGGEFSELAANINAMLDGLERASDERLRLRRAQITMLNDQSLALSAETDVDAATQHIVDAAADLVGAELAVLAIVDDDGQVARVAVGGPAAPADAPAAAWLRSPAGLVTQLLALRDAPLRIADLAEFPGDPGLGSAHPPVRALVGVPMIFAGQPVGVLYAVNPRAGRPFSEIEAEILFLFALEAAAILQTVRLYSTIEVLAAERERQSLARELHDGVAQVLSFVNTKAQAVEQYLARGNEPLARQHLDELTRAVRRSTAMSAKASSASRSPAWRGAISRMCSVNT